jgi:hypothetical protein
MSQISKRQVISHDYCTKLQSTVYPFQHIQQQQQQQQKGEKHITFFFAGRFAGDKVHRTAANFEALLNLFKWLYGSPQSQLCSYFKKKNKRLNGLATLKLIYHTYDTKNFIMVPQKQVDK